MKLPEPTPAALNEELPDSPLASVARALPAGTWLDEFELGEIIGEGSTAIVYAATDRARAVPVTIAEYMPASLRSVITKRRSRRGLPRRPMPSRKG